MDSSIFLNLAKFNLQDVIGKGSFGKVYKITDKATEQVLAAKESYYELDEEQSSLMENLKREVNILSQLNHPSVLKFIGYSPINFKGELKPVIVTEYSTNGTLEDILKQELRSLSPETWNDTKKLINIYGIASAMAYLHSHNIIHRDLKPANILENDYLFPKIADFGFSKIIHQNQESMSLQSTNGFKGTPIYAAPESWAEYEYTKACDVYAFAIIVYQIVTTEEPFPNLNLPMLLNKVVFQGYRPEFKHPIADCYKNLITRCWSANPEKRPTFADIVNELKTDEAFILDTVDKNEYYNYIDLIENIGNAFNPNKKFQKMIHSKLPEKIIENNESEDQNEDSQKIKISDQSKFSNQPEEEEQKNIEKERIDKEKIEKQKTTTKKHGLRTPLSYTANEKKPVPFFTVLNDKYLSYVIASTQCIIRIYPIKIFFGNSKQHFSSYSHPVSQAYQRFIKKTKEPFPNLNMITITLKKLKMTVKPKFKELSEYDAREFIINLIDKLKLENISNKQCHDIFKLLSCKIVNSFTCTSCNRIIDLSAEKYVILDLPVENNTSLDKCLQNLIIGEIVEQKCQYCNENTIRKKSEIIKWPSYLILSLNKKNEEQHISCTETLQIEKYSNNFSGSYSLFGIIFHEGPPEIGHYYVVVKSSDKWNLI